ncbi:putative uncharacterized protein [Clostridium sp. CAG:167]|nr:putative uncharacterized protein [Clostridium sp. CAG:167]
MNFIDRLEKRYPNFGVSNLMIYVIAISGLGMLISMVNPYIYYQYLSLDFYQIFHHGQVWRLITFLLCPSAGGSGSSGLFWFVIMAWVYYSIGSNLERIWGRFRFTLFYLSGIVMILIVTLAAYLIMGIVYPAQEVGIWLGMQVTLEYVTESLFLAFALVFPDVQFLLFFIIPVKAKWLSIFYFALDAYQIIQGIMMKSYYPVALIVVSLINIFIFFFFAKGSPGMAAHARQTKRKAEFKQKMHESREKGPIHRCAICGRTELDAPELDFRYCSKCDGRYEYCSEHLFTHEHVHHK